MGVLRPIGSFQANISIRHTAADALGSSVWALHVPAVANPRKLILRRFNFIMEFDGTAAAATSCAYELIRCTGTADPSTGTTVGRVKKRGKYSNSIIADANIQQKSGILTFAPTFDPSGPFHVIRLPIAVTNGVIADDLEFCPPGGYDRQGFQEGPHVFYPDEGWAVRLHLAAVIGLNLSGSFEWDEVAATPS